MKQETNPRKITQSGGMCVVSIPKDFLDVIGLEKGDKVVLEEAERGFKAEKVEFRRVTCD